MGALKKIDDHLMNLRDTRARQILAAARANLAGHVSRDDRVAAALKLARANVVRFDPKRLGSTQAGASARQQQLETDAAVARRKRVERTLSAARDTLRRVAHIKPPSPLSEIVHKTTAHARVAPEAPAPMARNATLQSGAMGSLADRFETLRAAVPEAMGELIGDVRLEWERETNCLRRELDVTRREIDLLRRTVDGLRARPS